MWPCPRAAWAIRSTTCWPAIGYGCPEDYNATRKLVVENPAAGIRYFLVKPSDVAIYVEHGAADVGIVGKDILDREPLPMCTSCWTPAWANAGCAWQAPADYQDDPSRPVRVATKFVNIAKSYYAVHGPGHRHHQAERFH